MLNQHYILIDHKMPVKRPTYQFEDKLWS